MTTVSDSTATPPGSTPPAAHAPARLRRRPARRRPARRLPDPPRRRLAICRQFRRHRRPLVRPARTDRPSQRRARPCGAAAPTGCWPVSPAGLGEYFGVDPVLFRVLFATSAFFGGVGIIAYLVAWAVIPERGAPSAPLDGAARWLRQRRVPFGVAVAAAAIVAWMALFSWWRPWPFFPLLIVAILLVVVLERNRNQRLAAHGAGTVPPVAPPNVAPTSTSLTDYPFASQRSRSRRDRTDPSLPTTASDRRADRVSVPGCQSPATLAFGAARRTGRCDWPSGAR